MHQPSDAPRDPHTRAGAQIGTAQISPAMHRNSVQASHANVRVEVQMYFGKLSNKILFSDAVQNEHACAALPYHVGGEESICSMRNLNNYVCGEVIAPGAALTSAEW